MATTYKDIFDEVELEQKGDKDIFDEISIEEESSPLELSESPTQKTLRNITRSGARAAESIFGTPGDIVENVGRLTESALESLGVAPKDSESFKKFLPYIPKMPWFQTSEDIKKYGEKLFDKEYLTPKTAGEKFSDETVEFIAPLLVPFEGGANLAAKTARRALKALGSSLPAATALGEGEGKESARNSLRSGSYFLMSLFNPKGLNNYIKNLYKQRDASLPKNASVFTSGLKRNLEDIKKTLTKSLSPSSTEQKIINKISSINSKLGHRVHPETLIKTKNSINSEISDLILDSSPSNRKALRGLLKRMTGAVNESIRNYGKTNKKFWEYHKAADRATAARDQSNFITYHITKALGKSRLSRMAGVLPYLALGASTALKKGVGPAASLAASYHMGKFVYRYSRSPALRRYYHQLISSGLRGSAKGIEAAASRLEKELAKDEEK